jgi:hypothetical protein
MPSREQSERIGGVTLLGVPVFDFFVWTLDNYGRVELLVKLHGLLPSFLTSPLTIFICLLAGLGLLYLSGQEQLRRVAGKSANSRPLVDTSGNEIITAEKPGWALPLAAVFILALLATPIVAIAYSLAYKGSPPNISRPSPPASAYTKTASPNPAGASQLRIEQNSAAPNSPNVVGNNNQFSYSAEPPNRFLNQMQAATFVKSLSAAASAPFWVIIETMNYDQGSEQMLFGHQLTDLLKAANWRYLNNGVDADIVAPLYMQGDYRGVIIATMPSLLSSAQALSKELNRQLIRNTIRGFSESGIVREKFKGDFILLIVGTQ